ncbi:GerW family sporulation protein [Psychrobacillus sp. OK032]|uniref:GerW family sporulation protein n=1 Tax=Psychrobacillus sp. OK032 TaxID=1884358 RepID=UPI0008B1AF22|nr:spore germination protein GerW family protein [Psychrobacillus sp. OK032]SES30447.1 Sporulation protein YtfJ (Spore_YtfJ) [Psychrobacillus sp. OK032]
MDKHSIYHSPIRSVFDKFSRAKDASLVYGEPIELDRKQVLPVAKVNYYVGGGGGYSDMGEEESTAQGEGGGGYFSIKPVGVFEITPEKVKFKPIINMYFVLTILSVVTLGLGFLFKSSRKFK